VVSLTSSSGGYINGRNSANLELLIDKTSSIYLYVKLKGSKIYQDPFPIQKTLIVLLLNKPSYNILLLTQEIFFLNQILILLQIIVDLNNKKMYKVFKFDTVLQIGCLHKELYMPFSPSALLRCHVILETTIFVLFLAEYWI
jgi:hypothetical protein